MKQIRARIWMGMFLLAQWGCGEIAGTQIETPDIHVSKSIQLQSVTSCTELEEMVQEAMIIKMEKQLEDQSKSFCFAPVLESNGNGSTELYTPTNVQEEGVDESDIFKIEGEFAYTLTSDGLKILRVWPVEKFGEVATLSLKQKPDSIFVDGKIVTVLAQEYFPSTQATPQLHIIWVNVADPTQPKIIEERVYKGRLSTARQIHSKLHLLLQQEFRTPPLDYVDEALWPRCNEPISAEYSKALDALKRKNRSRIRQFSLQDFTEATCQQFQYTEGDPYPSSVSLLSIDSNRKENQISVLAESNMGYASETSFYVAQNRWWEDKTILHRFSLAGGPAYKGSNEVKGILRNTFSMGEYKHVLRVATTTSPLSDQENREVYNQVYTLDAQGENLKILGKTDPLAPGEQIYAVRFIGERGYVVTFERIDPLFVINLEDPNNPQIMGELKVPGFSTYLHPLGKDRLIGLGIDIVGMVNQGAFPSWLQKLKLSIFDVSTDNMPQELFSQDIGGPGTSSLAMNDHHAFTFDPIHNLLALPLSVASEALGEDGWAQWEYNGLHLFHVDEKGHLETVGIFNFNSYMRSLEVERSFFIGDKKNTGLILLRTDGVSIHAMDETLTEQGFVPVVRETGLWTY